MIAAVIDVGPWLLAYVMGVLFGCTSAALCTALVNRCIFLLYTRRGGAAASPAPLLSRHARAEKLLEEMRRQRMKVASDVLRGAAEEKDADRTAASAAESVNRKGCDGEGVGSCNSSCSGSSWESKSSDTDDDDGDSEYEQMEELRLKMMFVVRHPVQPKMSAQEVAVLTASAGVELVELHQSSQSVASQSITETSDRCLVSRSTLLVYSPTEEDRQRWLQWYLWWTRIGCAKITLKCPDEATITEVMKAAEDKRLPVVYLYRSQSTSQDGVTSRKAVPSAFDEVVVVALGPAPSDVLQSVTGALKLFS